MSQPTPAESLPAFDQYAAQLGRQSVEEAADEAAAGNDRTPVTQAHRSAIATAVRRNCTPSGEAYVAGGDRLVYAVADWIENPPEWVKFANADVVTSLWGEMERAAADYAAIPEHLRPVITAPGALMPAAPRPNRTALAAHLYRDHVTMSGNPQPSWETVDQGPWLRRADEAIAVLGGAA